MTAHIHAALMAQYAQDALTTDTPWELWQFRECSFLPWKKLFAHPLWTHTKEYRRAPQRQWYRVALCRSEPTGKSWTCIIEVESSKSYLESRDTFVRWLTDRVYYDVE